MVYFKRAEFWHRTGLTLVGPARTCHNAYKDSTGGDFKLGGTMGGVVIYTPLAD